MELTKSHVLNFYSLIYTGITLGGISRKPWVVQNDDGKEEILPRDILHITISFDHDIVDGARGARFASLLIESIEAAVLEEKTENPNEAEKKI